MNPTTAKMLQPIPSHPFLKTSTMSLPTRSHHSTEFQQGRDRLSWGQRKPQPSSEQSHSGQGCSDALCKPNP